MSKPAKHAVQRTPPGTTCESTLYPCLSCTEAQAIWVMRKDRAFHRLSCSLAILGLLAVSRVIAQEKLEKKDFSRRSSVAITFGEAEIGTRVSGDGLDHRSYSSDGITVPETVQGVSCRSLHLTDRGVPKGYFFFTIDPGFKQQDLARVKIEVDYFDGLEPSGGVFGLQYDAKGSDENRVLTVKQILPNVLLKGSGRWLKATFHVPDGRFANSQGHKSDFRIWASPPELSISRLTVTVETSDPPTNAPLRFDARGEASLADWNLQWDSGVKPSFSSVKSRNDEPAALVIRAPDAVSVGSWRTAVFLEPGIYQFIGKAKVEGFDPAAEEERSGISLRISGRGVAKMVTQAPDWTEIRYDFTLADPEWVELVCELRASQGTARFDLGSLKVVRRKS
jgi:hypothetical protein